ncbi:hypothetical protein C8R42DRAFT_640651 [Lentinula raphanica]|nr:hypothetical protein C8R42DRAFT_730112 [Lentinula raphanica]KAJ3724721.1 hypothetical protein C8R42DRAFT_640651 [Lentinula raphanica]
MFTFRPARFSSPAKSTKQISSTANSEEDVSRFSHSSNIPELAGSSPEDVELIDTIIERASPSATTFLPVFKAYNDVLLERELDPHGAKCYGELLKLGTLKGSSWQDKWDTIKAQNGYAIPPRAGPSTILSDDLFSSGLRDSQMSCSENSSIGDASSTVFPSREGSGCATLTQNSSDLELDDDFLASTS